MNVMENSFDYTKIGKVTNYYGGVLVKIQDGKFFWSIENYTAIEYLEWEEISESLYKELIKHNESNK